MKVRWSARAAAEFAATAAYVANEFGEQAARKIQGEINDGVSCMQH